jgi:hypothetical protein
MKKYVDGNILKIIGALKETELSTKKGIPFGGIPLYKERSRIKLQR